MITLRKLESLKDGTRIRKYPSVLKQLQAEAGEDAAAAGTYLSGLCGMILKDVDRGLLGDPDGRVRAGAEGLISGTVQQLRDVDNLRYAVLASLDAEPADWDLVSVSADSDRVPCPGRFTIYLDDLRSPFNLGSVFRTAECFGAEKIILSADCPYPGHRRALRSSMGCTELVPWKRMPLEEAAAGTAVFALETGGTPVDEFRFPPCGMVIIGSEELGVSPSGLRLADESAGRVSIPMSGRKGSLNVSVAFGILMHRWHSSL